MTNVQHNALMGSDLHQPFHYEQSTDPGDIGARGYWLDTSASPYTLRRRNATNDGWVVITGDGATILLANNEWVRARNAANTADVDLVRVDSDDNIAFGGSIAIHGQLQAGMAVNPAGVNLVPMQGGPSLYMVMVSSNYNSGNNVRSAYYAVQSNAEGTGITNVAEVYVYNGQTATFTVSAGWLHMANASAENTFVTVITTTGNMAL